MPEFTYPEFTVTACTGLIPIALFQVFSEDARTRVEMFTDGDTDPLLLCGLLLVAAAATNPPPHMGVKINAMLQEIEATAHGDPEDFPF